MRALTLLFLLVACSPATERPSAVLITLDTTRSDALGCLGGRPGVTPHLDALAREGIVYEGARTVAPVTLPAHASMMTGLYPPRHGVRDNNWIALTDAAWTLAEGARDGGCSTAAFLGAAVLDAEWGLAQGFETYDVPAAQSGDRPSHQDERSAQETVRAAQKWLEERDRSRPFFLWVHFFDPHSPYEPDARSRVQAGGDAYLGEVAEMDRAIGEFLAVLRKDECGDRTTLVVIADHGESLGEHGEPTHSVLCYRATISIPFLVRHPDAWRAGERSPEIVSVVDVAPTIADALKIPVPPELDGISLDHRRAPDDRGVYLESYVGYLNYGWSPIVGWADASAMYLASPEAEWYDAREDPEERTNQASRRSPEIERARAKIAGVAARPALPARAAGLIDEELRARVRALGYAGAADPSATLPAPLEDTGRPSPRDRMPELAAYYAAVDRANAGDVARSISELQAIVREHPANLAALDMLGALLVNQGRHAEAIPVLERMLASGGERVTTHTNLGLCHEAAGRLEQALRHYRRAEELGPGAEEATKNLARLLATLDRERR